MPPKSQKKGEKKKKKKRSAKGPAVVAAVSEEGKLPPLTTDPRWATLQTAVVAQDTVSLRRLVAHYDYRKDLGKVGSDRSTLLMTAIKTNNLASLRELLGYEAIDVNSREDSMLGGRSALHHACVLNKPAFVDSLLKARANPDLKADSTLGETPLMLACKLGHFQCAQLLLQHGASTSIRDNFGNNASFWAYRHSNSDMIRDLPLPPVHTPTAMEFAALQSQRIPGFVLPTIKVKASKKKGEDKKGKAKK